MEHEMKIVTIPLSNTDLKEILDKKKNGRNGIDFKNSKKNQGTTRQTIKS